MPDLKTQLQLIQQKIQSKIADAMNNEVADVVRKVEQEAIQEEVFDKYPNPVEYIRRSVGGLDDPNNMVANTQLQADGSVLLMVENITMSNPNYLPEGKEPFKIAGVIEYGHGWNGYIYDYPRKGAPYMKGRPFIRSTAEQLKNNPEIVKAFKKGLRRNGLNVK
jgi:hypothetical protein